MKNPSISLVPDLGISEISVATPLAKLARSYFYSRRVVGAFTFRQFVGKLWCNFRPTWSKVVCRNTDWQAVESGTTFRFLKIPLRDILQKCLQGKHPWNPLNINIIDGYSFRINVVLIVCLMRKSAKTSRCALQSRLRLTFLRVGNG